ncbi:hypothetical protein IW01_02485 [Pectobacterium brasiliense]|nr:hypothetical protein IW01_02485 [Pectobacterium brasiliense]
MNLLVNRFIMYRRFLQLIGIASWEGNRSRLMKKRALCGSIQHSGSYFIPHDVNIEMTNYSGRKLTVQYRIVIQTREH